MQLTLVTAGKLATGYFKEGAAAYRERLEAYASVAWTQVAAEPVRGRPQDAEQRQIRQQEAERLLDAVPDRAHTVALDRRGKQLSSKQLARWLQERAVSGDSRVAFVVGGPLGLAEEVRNRARTVWSLSRLTFPHELVPLILLEQLYRAFKIQRGEPYHY